MFRASASFADFRCTLIDIFLQTQAIREKVWRAISVNWINSISWILLISWRPTVYVIRRVSSSFADFRRLLRFWTDQDFFLENSRTWKVLEKHFGPWKSWKLKINLLDSPGKISLKITHLLAQWPITRHHDNMDTNSQECAYIWGEVAIGARGLHITQLKLYRP